MDETLVRAFPLTRRSALDAARSADAAERARGLRTVAGAYWRPVYSYLRLHWKKPHDAAADLTQDFFAQLVEKDLLARFDPGKARLRTYLRVCIDGLVSNEARAATRQKRSAPEFDFEAARAALAGRDAAASPEAEFEKEWSRAVFAMALQRLRERCERDQKQQHFALLEAYDLGEPERPSYAALAQRFAIAVTDVTNRLAWSRRELRASVFEVLGELTSSEEELREEARALLEPE